MRPASAGVLGVAEGIGTALAVHCATGMPVWSTINTTMLEGFEIPEGVEMVIVWADKDRSEAGQRSAQVLKTRLWAAGIPTVCGAKIGPISRIAANPALRRRRR